MSTTAAPTTWPGRARPTVGELEQAWQAIHAGRFRQPVGNGGPPAEAWTAAGTVVVVAGAHGWSGASTAALLVADGHARQGSSVRLVDAAAPARSGFAAAAATEHGVDRSGRWRVGQRGPMTVHRLVDPVGGVVDVPSPGRLAETCVTVVDAGWPVSDLLASADDGHWLGGLLWSAPLVLTARATVPGLRHAEAVLEALGECARPVTLLLVGVKRLPRWLLAAAGPQTLTVHRIGRLVTAPTRDDLAKAGLTPAALPRQLAGVGDRLAQLTTDPTTEPTAASSSDPLERAGFTPKSNATQREDDLS